MEARIIGVTELQRHCRQVIDDVVDQGRPVILTRGSRPAAVIVPYDEYVRGREEGESEALARIDAMFERRQAVGDQVSEEEAAAIALAEVHAFREARRRYQAEKGEHEAKR